MSSDFAELIARVRAGEPRATEELFHKYEPEVRMEVRRLMRDPRQWQGLDSQDVCQSVLGSFFVRAALGQYDLEDPAGVIRLLIGITQNKVNGLKRAVNRQCRDFRRVQALGGEEIKAGGPSPSEAVSAEEMHQAIFQALSPRQRELVERRMQGQNWARIAAEMGGTEESCRKEHSRALARVEERLGLSDEEEV